ncbi:MAG: DUF1501 domain-containing protein [Gemmatales bacterium]|nr:DUF1501 domain-containing protein [Gemmatales bacterium]
MLTLGEQRQRTCQGVTRREVLQIGFATGLGLTLADWLRFKAHAADSAARAQSVIFLWLWGGPSHLDTFDPKPKAPFEYRGPFAAIPTTISGVYFTELFPQLAQRARRLAIVRSLHTRSNDHGVAGTTGLTGSMSGSVNLGGQVAEGNLRPALGAVVARATGRSAGRLPPYLIIGGRLHQGKKPVVGEGGGTLGQRYDPFRIEYKYPSGVRIEALELAPDISPERLQHRRQLLTHLDQARRWLDTSSSAASLDVYQRQALDMLLSPNALRLFDLSQEPPALRQRYGLTRFGQSCLLARRLVEKNVPFVQVNWSNHVESEEDAGDGGWDMHYRNFEIMQNRHAPILDQALGALLDDLEQRGLLERTLVVAVGEFGRTPKINDKVGRDHWEHCYCALLAGGGIRPGVVYGESDDRGERPRVYPCTPADLHATILAALGISPEQLRNLNLPTDGRVLEPLLA